MRSDETSNELNDFQLGQEKLIHITKAARSATAANILAPLLCIPMFSEEVSTAHFLAWLSYMLISVLARTLIVFNVPLTREQIITPYSGLKKITLAVGLVGFGWGLGWPLMTPDLSMVNRMIYVYMTTAAMISSMFAYSVHRQTFYAFTLPIMIPAISTILWPVNIFPWPFLVGMAALYIVVLSIARNFSLVFTESVGLRFKNNQLYQELANERDQSIAANVAKSQFIASASHDLRQPLHAVNINLELFNISELKEKDATIVGKIKGSIVALNNMFESLLDMSKLDANSTRISNSPFNVSTLAASIKDIIEPSATQKGLSFSIDFPDCRVNGDRSALQQVISNLAMNSVQYTHHGFIQIHFMNEDGNLTVKVMDSGSGISPTDQKNIFKEFYRAQNTHGEHEGLGLGLSIVKRLTKMIGATIAVDSALGQGATFTLKTSYPIITNPETVDFHSPRPLRTEVNDHQSLEGKCIAIIEDDSTIADAYMETLVQRGAQIVRISENENDFHQQIETINCIDCILSDHQLKNSTCESLIHRIRENFNIDIPVIVVSGNVYLSTSDLSIKKNLTLLHKPLSLQRIIQAVMEIIENFRNDDDSKMMQDEFRHDV